MNQIYSTFDKFHIIFSQNTFLHHDIIFHAYAEMSAHSQGCKHNRHLSMTDTDSTPRRIFWEKAVHPYKVIHGSVNTTFYAHDNLEMKGTRFQKTTFL